MTFRERCALAIIERGTAGRWTEKGMEFATPGADAVAGLAQEFADAMAAERVKRDQVEAPEMPEPAPEHELPKTHAELGALLMNVLAKAEAENAKLRAVAEAARHAMSVGPDIDADVALMGALDAWRNDWRTK